MLNPALHYFAEVVECGSIRLAADRLQIAPSAISRQIMQLESELGVTLLFRNRSGVALTEPGRRVLEYIVSARRDTEQLRSALDDLSGLRRGRVVLATVEAMIGRVLPHAISAFSNKYPGIELEVRILGTHQVSEAVIRENADIGIALEPPL
jgi:DNA-binding transcriptional LysR family regulator